MFVNMASCALEWLDLTIDFDLDSQSKVGPLTDNESPACIGLVFIAEIMHCVDEI